MRAKTIRTTPESDNNDNVKESHHRRLGTSLGPLAIEFAEALLKHDRSKAMQALSHAMERSWTIADIEDKIIAPAVSRLGELWVRGRLDDATFTRAGAFAERVEWSFRQSLSS